ncbi:MAG: site-2 protease family protein [Candidatus Thorarchaeota archaeon]
MPSCAHCGNIIRGEPFYCRDCGLNYCSLHKDPIDHECNIVSENRNLQSLQAPPTSFEDDYSQVLSTSQGYDFQQSPPGITRGTTDGTYTWFRQESQIPANAFDPNSGIKFKGILFPHLSELIHFIIASVLIFAIGIMIFYNITLFTLGYGWVVFMLAGVYMTAFLFHEFGHRQVAKRFKLQTKFRLLTFGMLLTVFSLVAGLLNFPVPSLALPGAVVVLGLDKVSRQTGLCKAAGPSVNLVYGIILFIISFFIPPSLNPIGSLLVVSSYLNFMLGAFNMIPIGILDGQNIWKWNKKVYIFLAASLVGLLIVTLILTQGGINL